jgi:hypothetical protein
LPLPQSSFFREERASGGSVPDAHPGLPTIPSTDTPWYLHRLPQANKKGAG